MWNNRQQTKELMPELEVKLQIALFKIEENQAEKIAKNKI